MKPIDKLQAIAQHAEAYKKLSDVAHANHVSIRTVLREAIYNWTVLEEEEIKDKIIVFNKSELNLLQRYKIVCIFRDIKYEDGVNASVAKWMNDNRAMIE